MPSISRAEAQRVIEAWRERKYIRANMTHTYTLGCNFDEQNPWVLFRLNPNMCVGFEHVRDVYIAMGQLCVLHSGLPFCIPIRG